jgi:oligoendopeptidase F
MDASGDYRYWLEEMRHFKPHTPQRAGREGHQHQERDRLQRADHGCTTITNRYTFKLEVDGETKE